MFTWILCSLCTETDIRTLKYLDTLVTIVFLTESTDQFLLDWLGFHCMKSVQIRTKKNSLFGHFSRSVWCWEWVLPTDSHIYLAAYKLNETTSYWLFKQIPLALSYSVMFLLPNEWSESWKITYYSFAIYVQSYFKITSRSKDMVTFCSTVR